MPRGFRPRPAHARPPRTLALPLFDPLPRWSAPPRPAASGVSAHLHPRLDRSRFPSRRAPSPDDPIDAARLALGLARSAARWTTCREQARRFARWRARRGCRAQAQRRSAQKGNGRDAGRFRRVSPLRPGRPPGGRLAHYDPDAAAAGRISATSTRSWRTPTRWPATRSAPTRHDAGGCLCRTRRRRRDQQPDCRNAGRGNDETCPAAGRARDRGPPVIRRPRGGPAARRRLYGP